MLPGCIRLCAIYSGLMVSFVFLQALQELTDVLDKSAKDETKALLLTGSGNIFCTGLDLEKLLVTEHRRRHARSLAEALR